MNFFCSKQACQEHTRKQQKMQRIEQARQSEEYRRPNPCQTVFPVEDFISIQVVQEGKIINLKTYLYPQRGELKGILFLFHGLASYMNHGAHIAEAHTHIGIAVVGMDHRGNLENQSIQILGFGKSEGVRGFLESIELHLQDSKLFIHRVLEKFGNPKNIPIFLSGLSMGGMTSFRLALLNEFPIRGIVMYAPAIKSLQCNMFIGAVKALGCIVPKAKFIKPKRGMTTKNPQLTEDFQKDPYVYTDELLPGTAATIMKAMQDAPDLYNQLRTPWLCVQGGLDKLVDPDLAEELHIKSPAEDKTVLYYDNMWHDVWHEEEIYDILPKVVEWVRLRL
ncbi:hypothetical protein pb186bvf_016489 [Paramecium bursaria]